MVFLYLSQINNNTYKPSRIMYQPTVFVIDDDPSSRKGLERLIKASGFITESYTCAKDFLEAERNIEHGCIILDVQMPEMTGPQLQEELLKSDLVLPIIFISAYGDVPTTARVMKKGAVDFLTKPVDKDALIDTLRLSLKIDAENREEYDSIQAIQSKIIRLTNKEYEIMTFVITGMLNKQIAAAMNISEETVKIHRGRIMKKLEIVSVAELVRQCEKCGISPATV